MTVLYAMAALLTLQADPATQPAGIVLRATQAVERDSAARLRERWQAQWGRDTTDPSALFGLATLARLTYDYDRSDSLYRQLLVRFPSTSFAAWGRLGRAETESLRGSLDSADVELRHALSAARHSEDRVAEAEALIVLARVRVQTGPLDSAIVLLGTVDAIVPPSANATRAHLRCTRSLLLSRAGRPGARDDADAGRTLAKLAASRRLEALCFRALGEHLVQTVDDPLQTRVPFDSAEVLLRATRDEAELAMTLARRAADRLSYWDLVATRADASQALEAARASGNLAAEGLAHYLMGMTGWFTGDLASAEPDFRAAVNRFEQLDDRLGLLTAQRSQAWMAMALDRIDEAEEVLRTTEAQSALLGSIDGVYISRLGLMQVQCARGRWDEAHQQMEAVVEFLQRNRRTVWIPGLAYTRGLIALRRGQLDLAEQRLGEALRASEGEHLRRHAVQLRLAGVHVARGDVDLAYAVASKAADHLDSTRAQLTDRELRIVVFQTGTRWDDSDFGLGSVVAALVRHGRDADAFQLLERRRARDLADRFLRAEAVASLPLQHAPKGRPAEVDPATVVRDERTAVLEFLVGQRGQPSTVFILTTGGIQGLVLGADDSLGTRVARFNGLLKAGGSTASVGRQLHALLLDSALARVPSGVRRLVIVPDGPLHQLPFDALPMEGGEALVSRYAISLAPSAAIAAELWRRPPDARPPRVLALGDPQFALEASPSETEASPVMRSAFAGAGGLTRLRASAAEARSVSRFGKNSVLRLRDEASEAWVKQAALADFPVLHFATHALVDQRTPARTALALAPGIGEDGFLTPAELASMHLPADLVVLSACQTAGGVVIEGEGVQGLTGPLLEAGARAVVATHWNIPDRGIRPLMEGFYDGLSDGLPAGEALQRAKLEARARGVPAAQWAAFTLVGDPSVRVPLSRPRTATRWWVALGILLALVVGGVAWRGRRASA